MSYNIGTKGQSMKLEGGKLKTDQRKYFYMMWVQAEELPTTGDSEGQQCSGF